MQSIPRRDKCHDICFIQKEVVWDVATCVAAARFLAELARMVDPMPAILNKSTVHGFIHAACPAITSCQACTNAELPTCHVASSSENIKHTHVAC